MKSNKWFVALFGAGIGAALLAGVAALGRDDDFWWVWFVISVFCAVIVRLISTNMSRGFLAKVLVSSALFGAAFLIMAVGIYYQNDSFWIFGIAAGLLYIILRLIKEKSAPTPSS